MKHFVQIQERIIQGNIQPNSLLNIFQLAQLTSSGQEHQVTSATI